jgi:hypothetical protein
MCVYLSKSLDLVSDSEYNSYGIFRLQRHCQYTTAQEFSQYSRQMFNSVGIFRFEGFNYQGDGHAAYFIYGVR